MTAPEIVAACEADGLTLTATERGTVHCQPTPSPALLAELRANRDEVLALLRDPDRAGWEIPSAEAMAGARSARPRTNAPPPSSGRKHSVGVTPRDGGRMSETKVARIERQRPMGPKTLGRVRGFKGSTYPPRSGRTSTARLHLDKRIPALGAGPQEVF